MDLVKQTHMAANNIKQQTTFTMADGRRIKYTVLKRSSAGATMAKRSWNNAAPKGSFMHAGMPTHMAHITTGNKASKASDVEPFAIGTLSPRPSVLYWSTQL